MPTPTNQSRLRHLRIVAITVVIGVVLLFLQWCRGRQHVFRAVSSSTPATSQSTEPVPSLRTTFRCNEKERVERQALVPLQQLLKPSQVPYDSLVRTRGFLVADDPSGRVSSELLVERVDFPDAAIVDGGTTKWRRTEKITGGILGYEGTGAGKAAHDCNGKWVIVTGRARKRFGHELIFLVVSDMVLSADEGP